MTKIKQINIKTIFQMYFSYHNFHYTVSKINTILSIVKQNNNNKNKKRKLFIYNVLSNQDLHYKLNKYLQYCTLFYKYIQCVLCSF